MFGTYHLILFSNFVTNPNVQFKAGYSFFIMVALMFAFNLGKIMFDQVRDVILKRKLNAIKNGHIKRADEMIELKSILRKQAIGKILQTDYIKHNKRAEIRNFETSILDRVQELKDENQNLH